MKLRNLTWCCVLLLAGACSDDDSSASEKKKELIGIATEAHWQVTFYEEDGVEQTGDYGGWLFTFNESGVLTTAQGETVYEGNWSITREDDDDDTGLAALDFNIVFATPALMEELSEDWDISSYSNAKIELVDESGGDGSISYLTLEKVIITDL
jgi:hypothetical protein